MNLLLIYSPVNPLIEPTVYIYDGGRYGTAVYTGISTIILKNIREMLPYSL